MQEKVEEILQFIAPNARQDLKEIAVKHCLGFTGSDSGRELLGSHGSFLGSIISLLEDVNTEVTKNSFQILVNLSAEETFIRNILNIKDPDKGPTVLKVIFAILAQATSDLSDLACRLLCNLSRWSDGCQQVTEMLREGSVTLHMLVNKFTEGGKGHSEYDYLAPTIENLTQTTEGRRWLLDRTSGSLQKLLPYISCMWSEVRRRGIVGAVRNCCFEPDCHDWLLSDDVELLPHLLLPLAGPEEFDPDETDKLPVDLQYLAADKQREPCPCVRIMLIEAINQLCATKPCRLYIRDKQTYLILRELHKWEQDKLVLVACENLVDVMISDEPAPELENLHQVDIPEHLVDKFNKMDEELNKL